MADPLWLKCAYRRPAVHSIAADSKGNIFTAETFHGQGIVGPKPAGK